MGHGHQCRSGGCEQAQLPTYAHLPDFPGVAATTQAAAYQPIPQSEQATMAPSTLVPPDAHSKLHTCCVYNLTDAALELLRGGADPNERDANSYSPLHWAAVNNRMELCQLLVNRQADVNARANDGVTPLHWAALYGHFGVCHFLLSNGANVDARDSFGFTPFLRAAQGNFLAVVVLLRWHGCDVVSVDHQGHNALHWAAHFGLAELSGHLISMFKDVNMQDDDGNTALHIAAKGGHGHIASRLVGAGAVVGHRNKANDTAEDAARNNGKHSLARWLTLLRWIPPARRCMRQTSKSPAIMMFASSSIIAAYVYYALFLLGTGGHLAWAHMTIFFLSPIMWFSYIKAMTTSPGFVLDAPELVIEELAAQTVREEEVCLTCIVKKPRRSKHCGMCGSCVIQMDHHCGWINNCVGQNNRIYFVGFTFSVIICMTVWCIIDANYMLENTPEVTEVELGSAMRTLYRIGLMSQECPGAFVGFIVYALYVMFVFAVNVQLITGMFTNMTLNEKFNYRRYPHFRAADGSFFNPFSKGYIGNVKEFFVDSFNTPRGRTRAMHDVV